MPYWKNVKVIPTHEDVFDCRAKSEKEIVQELEQFSSYAILHICTKLMLFLNSEGALDPTKQVELARQLLNQETRERLADFVKASDSPDLAFFHHIPVLMLIKLNLEHNNSDGQEINNEATRMQFASMLISLCDTWISNERLIRQGNQKLVKKFKEGFRIYQSRQFLLEGNEPVINMLIRGRYLIDQLKQIENLKFEVLFEKATDMDVDKYLDILFMIMTQWTIKVEGKSLDEIAVRNINQFFKHTKLDKTDLEKFMGLISFRLEEYHALDSEMLKRVGMEGDKSATNFITFMNRPILRYEDNFICLSPNFLGLQLTQGPYNIVREALKSEKDPDLLVKAWGGVYESYISDRLSSAFTGNYHPNIKDKNGNQILDGLVDLGDFVLLVEIKYPHWPYRARMSGRKDDMHAFMEKIAYYPRYDKRGRLKSKSKKPKGLGQIKQFVLRLSENQDVLPVDLSKKTFIPTLILGEEFPCDPINREFLEGFCASSRCTISDKRVVPFIILTSEDVELIESLAESLDEDEIKKLLLGYAAGFHPKHRDQGYVNRVSSFKNEIFNRGIKVPNSKFMKSMLKQYTDPIHKYFKVTK